MPFRRLALLGVAGWRRWRLSVRLAPHLVVNSVLVLLMLFAYLGGG